ncbi:zinc-dependent peptidase [Formosa sp. PL04]|uniref:zinc-dependent peptidase n=1 Tax=Formosa sp. PL04 TaxID=3081755 RepID=UPI0029811997|nr:zinc-dependent peptidase [Formosa sp. PL04]MDW5287897.1 zinc-dependent peptidase [Formosa sp. PL04]
MPSKIILGLFLSLLFVIMVYYCFKMVEMVYVLRFKKPMFVHLYMSLKKMNELDKKLLYDNFNFYRTLNNKQRLYFDHRVLSFVKDKQFMGRDDLEVTNEMKLLISAHAVILTFGFRDFFIGLIDKIFIYPNKFYSSSNESYHAGEMNPRMKVLVISWSDFKNGLEMTNDSKCLGIHEFTHAIHLNSMKEGDVSSTIFTDSFKELAALLTKDEPLRQKLLNSRFFKGQVFLNQFQFLAVIMEHFIERPSEFRGQFPQVYAKTKQMLNFDFNGY